MTRIAINTSVLLKLNDIATELLDKSEAVRILLDRVHPAYDFDGFMLKCFFPSNDTYKWVNAEILEELLYSDLEVEVSDKMMSNEKFPDCVKFHSYRWPCEDCKISIWLTDKINIAIIRQGNRDVHEVDTVEELEAFLTKHSLCQ